MKNEAYGSESYIVNGDTAVFTFRSFFADRKGWEKYYKDGTLPSERDTFLAFRNAAEKAQNDPKVKNFIIDLSTNGGGESDAVMTIVSLITGNSCIYSENTLTGGAAAVYYNVDRDLDGRFDDNDSKVKYDLNFAVLTSNATFSSANLLASLLHENWIPIIGEQSGGGSCSVMVKPTADGWEYSHSSYTRLVDSELNNIDGGVPVDIPLVKTNEDGSKDYSAFFDIAQLSAKINDYYGNAEDDNPATGAEIPAVSALLSVAVIFLLRKRERTR